MKLRNTRSLSLCLSLVLLLVAATAGAYVLLDPPRTWSSTPTYIVDDRGLDSVTDSDGGVSNTVAAVTSTQAWNGTVSNVVDAQAGSVSGWQLGDSIPMLSFDDPEKVCNGSCLAATFIGYYQQRSDGTYEIFDADIVTNTRYDWTSTDETDGCSSEFYIEGVMVHEIGHGLGLGHTDVSGATMYPSVSSCNNDPATIEQDDADGLNALYGGGGGGGGGDDGGSCDLGQKGDSCSSDADCCSGKCRGGANKTCK